MAVDFQHEQHPHVASHKQGSPPKVGEHPVGINSRVAVLLTRVVGTMWCAYAFAVLALIALPSALASGDMLQLIQWISQTFIQLVMLSVIMVGQAIMSKGADARADATYKDAEATFHEAEQIQKHLKAQDAAINALLDKVAALETSLAAKS
jgi:hypothetical protein